MCAPICYWRMSIVCAPPHTWCASACAPERKRAHMRSQRMRAGCALLALNKPPPCLSLLQVRH
jgi:hypothetical protein